jgi:hypothetical protein
MLPVADALSAAGVAVTETNKSSSAIRGQRKRGVVFMRWISSTEA